MKTQTTKNQDKYYVPLQILTAVQAVESQGFRNRLGRMISFRRKELGLSQIDLAECIGKTRNYISKIEDGNELMAPGMISKLEYVLGISLQHYVIGSQYQLAKLRSLVH